MLSLWQVVNLISAGSVSTRPAPARRCEVCLRVCIVAALSRRLPCIVQTARGSVAATIKSSSSVMYLSAYLQDTVRDCCFKPSTHGHP